uniref:ATP-dependent DNA helicase n=1 Tax=Strongyloides papillosus TaxID=174720 RepID=A0A0N5B4L8_STREA
MSTISDLPSTSHTHVPETQMDLAPPSDAYRSDINSQQNEEDVEDIRITHNNLDFNTLLYREIGISNNVEQQNRIQASDIISENINNTDLSDDEDEINIIINSLESLTATDLLVEDTKKKNIDPQTSNMLVHHLDDILLISEEFKNTIRTNAKKIQHYTKTTANITRSPNSLSRCRKKDYKIVWEDTLKLSSQLGANLITDRVKRFTLVDNLYEEDDLEYARRFVGGYRYHFYHTGSDVQGYYTFNKVFTVAFHIFHSTDQYNNTVNFDFENYLKQLSHKKEETKKHQDLRYKICQQLFSNLYENQTSQDDAQQEGNINILSSLDPLNQGDLIIRNRQMLSDLENGYNFHASDRDPIENAYFKIGSLAKLCDSTCENLPTDFIEQLFTIIMAFQDPNNKMITLFAIKNYINEINFMENLEKYMKCYSRLRGFHRRLNEILSQLTWIREVIRLNNDSSLNDYSKFNIVLRRKLCINKITYTSNEIDFSSNIEIIEKLIHQYKNINLQICSICERLLFEDKMQVISSRSILHNRLRQLLPLTEINGIPVHSLKDHLSKINSNHQNITNDYVCSQCYKFTSATQNAGKIPKQCLRNNLYFDLVPNELKNLNYIEKLLVSKTWCVQSIFSITKLVKYRTEIRAVKGYAITFNIDNIKSFREITKPGTRKIIVQNKTKVGLVYTNIVDVLKVYNALKWLKVNNPYYKDDSLPNLNNRSEMLNFYKKIENQFLIHNSGDDSNGCIIEYNKYIPIHDYIPFVFEDGTTTGIKGDAIALFDLKYGTGRKGRLTDDKSLVTAFPWIYPYGRFSPYCERDTKITPAYYLKCVCRRADRKKVKDPQFIFALEKTEQEQEGIRNINTSMRFEGGTSFKTSDLGFYANKGKLLSVFSSNRLSDAYWKKVTNKLIVIETFIGPATWFMTLNPAAGDWPEVTDLYQKYYDPEFGQPFDLEKEIAKDPLIFNMFFQKRVTLLLDELKKNPNILGRVVYYYYKTEYQQRGPPHCHFLLWTEDGMTLDVSDDIKVREFLDKYVTCSLYKNNEELHNIVKKYQTHKCLSMYCLKRKLKPIPEHKLPAPAKDLKLRDKTYKLSKCRFGYPKKPRPETTIFRMDSTLESIMEISKRPHKAYELKRDIGEENINPYNPTIAMIFKSNTDLTFNALQITPAGAINYAAKYVSKSTLSCNEEVNKLMRELAFSKDKGIVNMLFKLAYSLHLRPQPYTEIIDAAIGSQTHDTSINVTYCTTENNENRTRITRPKKDMHGNYVGLATKDNIYDNYYILRPAVLEQSCLFQILANFVCRKTPEKYKIKCDNVDLHASFESQSEIIQRDGQEVSRNIYYFITKNTDKRHITSPCFLHSSKIEYPIRQFDVHFSPVKMKLLNYFNGLKILNPETSEEDEEDIYRRYCLLFVPYRSELYPESSKERFNNYMNYLKNNYPQSAKDIEILIDCSNRYIKKQVLQSDFRDYKKKTEERLRHLMMEEGNNIDEIGVYEDDDIDLLKDVQNVEELENNIRSLNYQQRQIFDLIYNSVKNELETRSTSRCKLLIDGPGGTGKSYLIRVLSEAVTYLCRSKLRYVQTSYPNVLLCGPTGMAAKQINGKTAHTLFGIPCNANFTYIKYTPLSSGKLTKLSETLKHVKLLIIDEISMIPNEMLYLINLRLNETKDTDTRLFGDLNVMLLGDMMQLPPVCNHANRPMFYKKIDINKFKKMFGTTFLHRSAFIDFKFIPLTENVRQKDDEKFGKILNSIRFGEITDEARILIQDRLIQTTLLETYNECQQTFGDCVVISPNNKTVNETNEFIIRSLAEDKSMACYEISCKDELFEQKTSNKRIFLKKKARYSHNPLASITLKELESSLTVFEKISTREENGLPEKLYICPHARIMLTRNRNVRMGLCNGARGYVISINTNGELGTATKLSALDVISITIKFDNCEEPVEIKPSFHKYVLGKVIIKRIQFPLQICYSMTVHKCQGLTLPSAIINFPSGLDVKINETPGLLYVALSRVRTSNSLFIYDLDIDKYNNVNIENIVQIQKMSRQLHTIDEDNVNDYNEDLNLSDYSNYDYDL